MSKVGQLHAANFATMEVMFMRREVFEDTPIGYVQTRASAQLLLQGLVRSTPGDPKFYIQAVTIGRSYHFIACVLILDRLNAFSAEQKTPKEIAYNTKLREDLRGYIHTQHADFIADRAKLEACKINSGIIDYVYNYLAQSSQQLPPAPGQAPTV